MSDDLIRNMRFILTAGHEEHVLAILTQEGEFDAHGLVGRPPSTVDHDGEEYNFKRQMMEGVYVYTQSDRKKINDFLGNKSH